MPIAVITFTFDPLVTLPGDLVVRWQTIGLAAVMLASLVVAAISARRVDLRPDDLLSMAVGAVPGAVIAGRLGYAIAHPAAFAGPTGLLDPGIPGLDLGLGVVGGVLTAAYVASLLGAPVGRWAAILALPLLVAIGAGKLTLILGGSGQGLPFDGAWATAFLGPGPWGSIAPELPSHPAQAYEGIGTLAVALGLALVSLAGGLRRPDARLLLVGIVGWSLVRAAASTTWRDPVTVGGLPTAGWLAIGIATGSVLLLIVMTVSARRSADGMTTSAPDGTGAAGGTEGVDWPEPESRPPF